MPKRELKLSDLLAVMSSASDARSLNPGGRGGYWIPYDEDTDRSPYAPGPRGGPPAWRGPETGRWTGPRRRGRSGGMRGPGGIYPFLGHRRDRT